MRKMIAILLVLLCFLPISAKASAYIQLDLSDPTFLTSQQELMTYYDTSDGLTPRSAIRFNDGSAAVFLSDMGADDLLTAVKEAAIDQKPVLDELLLFDGQSFSSPIKLSVRLQQSTRMGNPMQLVKAKDGAFWGVKQGAIPYWVVPPRGGSFIADYHSSVITKFNAEAELRSIDLADYTGSTDAYIVQLLDGEEILYVSMWDQTKTILALSSDDGRLLFKITAAGYPVILADGRFALLQDRHLSIYDQTGTLIETRDLSNMRGTSHLYTLIKPEAINDDTFLVTEDRWLGLDYAPRFTYWQVWDRQLRRVVKDGLAPAGLFVLNPELSIRLSTSKVEAIRIKTVSITANGEPVISHYPPVLDAHDGRAWVPLRAIVEAMQMTVEYHAGLQTITIRDGAKLIHLDESNPSVELRSLGLSTRYIRARDLASLLGCQVEWDQERMMVIFTR